MLSYKGYCLLGITLGFSKCHTQTLSKTNRDNYFAATWQKNLWRIAQMNCFTKNLSFFWKSYCQK